MKHNMITSSMVTITIMVANIAIPDIITINGITLNTTITDDATHSECDDDYYYDGCNCYDNGYYGGYNAYGNDYRWASTTATATTTTLYVRAACERPCGMWKEGCRPLWGWVSLFYSAPLQ